MTEIDWQQLKGITEGRKTHMALFVYTPLCGTCKVAERMLAIVEKMVPDLPVYRCNLNRMPQIAERWKITSVPCLMMFKDGKVAKRTYAMKSVQDLWSFLSS